MNKTLVVITAVNLWHEYTKRAVETLFNQNVDVDILLVDNGSIDDMKTEGANLANKDDRVFFKRYDTNVGVQEAWNNAIKFGFENGYEYIVIANNDVLYHKNAINVLEQRMERGDDDVAMVTSINLHCECGVPDEIFDKDENEKKDVPESEHPDFSSFMINKKTIEKVGYFDKGFFPAYYEDNSMHYKIQKAGLRAICCPTSMYYHFGSATQKSIKYGQGKVKSQQFQRSKAYFVKKWGGLPGHEKFDRPFNDSKKSLKWTIQDACKENCQCDVKCQDIINWLKQRN